MAKADEDVKEKTTAVSVAKQFRRSLSNIHMTVMIAAPFIESMGRVLQEESAEEYYAMKSEIRSLIESLEKYLPELKTSFAKMK